MKMFKKARSYVFLSLIMVALVLSLVVSAAPIVQINEAEFHDKVFACWLGKNIGGTLGMPFEGSQSTHNITYYTNLNGQPAANDDLDLQLLWLKAMQDKNAAIDCRILGEHWLQYVPVDWNEYGVGKMNMRRGILAPLSGEYENAQWKHSNGAWIRSEIWACITPGSTGQAAKFAREDACVDHGAAEGTIAEIFTASVESAAFIQHDRDTLINIGLSMIPSNSRVAVAVRAVLDAKTAGKDWLGARQDVINATQDTGWFQAPRNVAFMIIGWVYGNGDFGQSICTAVNCGDDTDCTGATLGSILGIIGGTSGIPQNWKDPIGTSIQCVAISGFTHPNDIGTLTDQTVAMTKQVQTKYNLPVAITTGATDMSRASELNLSDTVTAQALWALSPYKIVWNETDEQVTLDYLGDPLIQATLARNLTVTVKNLTGSAKTYNISLTGVPSGWQLSGLPTQATLAASEERVFNFSLTTTGIQSEARMTVIVTGGVATVNVPVTLFGRGAPPVVNGTAYSITAKHSGKCVSVENSGTADGVNVYQWDWGTSTAQMWKVEDAGNGYFKLTNINSGKCLTIDSSNPGAEGDNIYQWSWINSDRQMWRIEDIGGGYCTITCKNSGKCVSVLDSLTTNGGNIHQWSWGNADAQRWSFAVASPTTPTPTPTPGSGSWTRVNDNSSGVTYLAGVATANISGYYNGDVHFSNTAAQYAQYAFTGTGVRWIGKLGNDHGKVDVYIDGTLITVVDTYSATDLLQQICYEKTGLTNGSHTLKIVLRSDKNSASLDYYTDWDAFEYYTGGATPTPSPTPTPTPTATPTPSPTPVSTWTRVNDTASGATYSTGVSYSSKTGYYNGDVHFSKTAGHYAQFAFTGTGVRWIGKLGYDHGKADVYIDGTLLATVDTYNAAEYLQQVCYEKTGLASGSHMLKIVLRSDKNSASSDYYTDWDAFEYLN
jgi:ADP-ribosylglycohydrolase